ncbi:V-type ATP synthase subunit F [Clostridia bacterium]|nr:V-type ATP synthase subunit F [Clostridia bacterium]
MKFFLVSDNTDTYIGMRMAGIEGVVVHEADEVRAAIKRASSDGETGVILITAKLMDLCRAEIYGLKLSMSRPLIVEVADRHGDGKVSDSITRYVREAVGIKI